MSNNKTTNEITTTTMVESTESPNPIFPFLPNFNFNFQLPHFLFPPKTKHHDGDKNNKLIPKQIHHGDAPNVVTFPKNQSGVVIHEPLQAEPDPNSASAKTSDPFILYQVYAIGAFFVSRWIWARWNERKARGKSPNDDDSGSQENE